MADDDNQNPGQDPSSGEPGAHDSGGSPGGAPEGKPQADEQAKKLRAEAASWRTKYRALETQHQELTTQVAELREKVDGELPEAEQALRGVKRERDRLQSELDADRNELKTLRAETAKSAARREYEAMVEKTVAEDRRGDALEFFDIRAQVTDDGEVVVKYQADLLPVEMYHKNLLEDKGDKWKPATIKKPGSGGGDAQGRRESKDDGKDGKEEPNEPTTLNEASAAQKLIKAGLEKRTAAR